ncbi:MAG: hypothetical protein AB1652_05540, partial [Bacillota bacterium]
GTAAAVLYCRKSFCFPKENKVEKQDILCYDIQKQRLEREIAGEAHSGGPGFKQTGRSGPDFRAFKQAGF